MDNQLKKSNSYCLKRLLGRGQLAYIKQINFKFWPVLLPTNITQYINLLITCSKLQKLLLFWCLKIFSTIQQTTGSVLLLLLYCGATGSVLLYILWSY